ncbi:MAG TPA: hypothetical protein GXZ86_08815 [Clostridiales bacterium]|jgi:hypothetical protein|nr:hypothetical protein [Clostridiales bacterium]
MDYIIIRNHIKKMAETDHKNFVKAVISIEKSIHDELTLNKLYEAYMENDMVDLLNEEFSCMIDNLEEQGR